MTVAPRAAASGASCRETSVAGREEGDVDAFESLGRRLAHRESSPVGADSRSGGPAGGEQSKLADRETPLGQDLDHRSSDDAGGADDRDGQRSGFSGHGSTTLLGLRARSEYTSGPGDVGPGVHMRTPMRMDMHRWMQSRPASRSRRSPAGPNHDAKASSSVRARWRCIAALRERLMRPWRSISVTTTMTSSPTETTSSTVGTW